MGPVLTISHDYNAETSLIVIGIGQKTTRDDYQRGLSSLMKQLSTTTSYDFVLHFDRSHTHPAATEKTHGDKLLLDLRNYMRRMAIVCDPAYLTRAEELAGLVASQQKPTKVFTSMSDAEDWISRHEA